MHSLHFVENFGGIQLETSHYPLNIWLKYPLFYHLGANEGIHLSERNVLIYLMG